MKQFIDRHKNDIAGVLSCYDRIVFRGYMRSIQYADGLKRYLIYRNILLKDFGKYAKDQSDLIKAHAIRLSESENRPYIYLKSPRTSKESVAKEIAQRDQIENGLICVLSSVELCISYDIYRNKKTRHLELINRMRKCLFIYYYYMDKQFGLMYIRLQSWLPFSIQVGINGHNFLSKRLDAKNIGYKKYDNCFIEIDDFKYAQELSDKILKVNWPKILNKLANKINPLLSEPAKQRIGHYYWVCHQSEYATDILFKNTVSLKNIYEKLAHHSILRFKAESVLRFLGKRYRSDFKGEAKSTYKKRPEGVCIKHWVQKNSIKMYDKAFRVLRIEVTINEPKIFRVYREVEGKDGRTMKWTTMRKGVADFWRRAEVSKAANERYLEALSVVNSDIPSYKLLDKVNKNIKSNKKSFRPIRAIEIEECNVFKAILRGENFIQGFRNKDIRDRLYKNITSNPKEARRRANKIGYLFRLYRVHGLIKKVPKTRLYRITEKGNKVMATAIQFRMPEINLLKEAASF